MGKTSLAKALAASIDCALGAGAVHARPAARPTWSASPCGTEPTSSFEFRPGRCSPTSSSATRSTGPRPRRSRRCSRPWRSARSPSTATTYPLAAPFMVIATQNPIEHEGTYPLPESQLDRFLMRVSIGYPDRDAELEILDTHGDHDALAELGPVVTAADVEAMVAAVARRPRGPGAEGLPRRPGRRHPPPPGARPRHVAPGHARACSAPPGPGPRPPGATTSIPDDVKALAGPVLAHRLLLTPEAQLQGITAADVVERGPPRRPRARPARPSVSRCSTRRGWLVLASAAVVLLVAGALLGVARAVVARPPSRIAPGRGRRRRACASRLRLEVGPRAAPAPGPRRRRRAGVELRGRQPRARAAPPSCACATPSPAPAAPACSWRRSAAASRPGPPTACPPSGAASSRRPARGRGRRPVRAGPSAPTARRRLPS